jgi:YD repeat-containing protein
MVALVAGNGLGLFNASLNSLGGAGVLGQGTIGQAGGQSLVNVSNGNLVMRFTDEQLSGLGQDLFHTRTYNTQGALNDADGDGWRWDGERKVVLNGTRNTAGSTLVRTSGDGHEAVYRWTGSIYQSTTGSGAHDSLSWDATTGQWVWTEGSSRTVERYDGTTGRLLSETDRSGVQILYTYDANGRLSSVKDSASGQELVLVYDAQGKLSRLDTRTTADGALTRQIYYGYDAAGRLSSVTTDLTPANNSITDGKVYTSTYTYDGDSFRITSMTQSDGSSVAFTYQLVGGDYRVSSVTDASGTTTFTYEVASNRTDVSNGSGQVWSYFYDAQGQLLEVQTPAVNGQRLSTRYAYDADGNVTQVTDGRGNAVTYTYDAQGNRTLERDAQGNTVAWTYSTTNQVLNEIRYSAPATWNSTTSTWTNPAASTPQVKRFVYDANNRLSHAVSATGTVTAYVYTSSGLLQREVTYTGAAYAVSGLPATETITLAQATTWTDTQDKSRTTLSEYVYDYRGNLNKRTAYASVDNAGAGVLDAAAVVTQYTYNEHGQLLQTIAVRGAERTSTTTVSATVYDGLGRVISQVDANGTRTYLYNGTNRTVTVTNTAGMTVTQAFDTAGRLVSLTQSASGLVTRTSQYSYDAAGRLVMTQDPTGVRTYTFYDEAGRISARVDGVGAVVEYSYNEAGQKTQEKQYATLVDTSTWYNGTTVTKPLSQARPASTVDDRSISYAYDAAGRLSTLTNTAGTVTTYTYDGRSQLVKQQTGDRVIRYFFDAEGRQVAQLDGEGYLREQVYDSAGRLQQVIRYATVATASLRAAGTLAQLRPTAGQNLQTWYFYDGLNRQVGSVDEQQFVTATIYDDAANTVQTLRYAATYETVISTATTFATVQAAVASSPQQTATTAFDAMGRVGQKTATDGTITAYEYDTAGRLIRQTYALGSSEARVQTTRYDAFGQVTGSLLGEASNRIVAGMTSAQIAAIYTEYGITYTYDAMGRVASARDAKGNRTMSYYDAEGRLTHVVNGLGEVNETVYNAFGDASERTAFSARLSASNTASLIGGVLTTSVKPLVQAIRNAAVDNRRTYTYNTLGLLSASTDALGYLTSYTYNVFGEQSSVIRTIGSGQTVTHSLTYNKRGEQLTRIDDVGGLARSTSKGYDAFGRVIRQTDGLGKATVTRYDNYGRTIVVSNPLNQSQSTTYDAFARVLSSVDALNQSTTYSYDDNTRTLTVTTPDGVSISSVKNRHGETLSVTDGTGYTTNYSYNLDGQRLSTTDALNQSTLNGYDEAGRLISVTDTMGRITRYGYDAANRVITRTNANNTVTRYTFDGQGRQIRVTDAEGLAEQRITDYAYDRKGQVLTVTQDPNGLKLTTTYTYDELGQQIQVARGTTASPNQQITLYTFDKLGRRISEQLGSGVLNLTTQYHYDNNDQVTRKIDARNASTWYVYNDAGDLITTVDALGGVTSNAYDSNGNVTSSTRYGTALSTTVLATFGNRVVSVAPTANSAVDQTTHYVYDAVDQVRYTVAANGAVSETVYDNNGQVLHSRQYDKVIASTATKTVAGIAAALTSAGAQPRTTSYLYDEVGQLKRTTDAAGKIESYTYDAVGNRTSLTNKNGAVWNYSYDALNRLTEEASPAVSVSSINTSGTVTAATRLIITRFSYDALGNIKSRTEGVQRAALNSDPALDDLTQTRTTGYDYDAVGHQIRITSPGWYNKATGAYQQNADTTTPANTFQITTEVTYDALGNAVRNRVRVNNTGTAATDYVDTYKVYDILGRLTHDIDALKGVVTYGYDATGNQTTVKRFANALTAAVPASGFYVASNITASTLVANASLDRTLTTSYDLLNRKTAVQQDQVNLYSFTGSVSGSSTITAAPTVLYSYNALGQLTRQTEVARNTSGTTVQTGASNYYYYDLAGNRTGTVDTLGYYTRSEYNALGKQVRQVEYANALSNWSEGTTPANPTANNNDRSTRLVYDAMGRLSSVVQEGVRYWQQSINAQTNVVSATQITGDLTVSQTTYDNVGNVKTQRDAANNVVTTNYDALGRVTQLIEPARATAKSDTADPFTLTVVVASPTTTYSVDAFGQVVREIRAAGSNQAGISQTTHTRYDAAGYEVQTIEANGSSLLYKVDVAGRRLEEKRQTSVTLSAWTVNGVAMTRAQTLRRTFTFDALGQQTATIDWYTAADNTLKSTTNSVIYNRFGEVEQQLLNGSLQTRYTYDKVGNAIEQLNPQGLTKVDYDLAGNATRSNQDGDTTITTDDRITYTRYDLLGRALEQHLPAFEANINVDTINNTNLTLTTPIIQQTYDRWNNLLSRTDARGYITTYSYDHNNRQLTETLPETDILRENGTSYRASLIHEKRYDGVGNLIQDVDLVSPYAGVPTSTELRTRQHVYNAVGELTRDVDALGFSRNYRVDAHGNRVATQDALGTVLVQTYDAMDRQLTHGIIRGGNAVILKTNEYDQAGRLVGEITGATAVEETLASTANADWTSTTTGVAGTVRYTLFDERGNIVRTRNESKIEKGYEYNEYNRKVKEIDGLNKTLTWTYNEGDFGKLASRTDMSGVTYSFTYNEFGQMTRDSQLISTPNGIVVGAERSYTYYANGLSKAITEGTVKNKTSGTSTLEDTRTSSYEYDLGGNRIRETNSALYLTLPVKQSSSHEVQYSFDEKNRLREVVAPAGNQLVGALGTQYTSTNTAKINSLKYSYDELDNRRRIYMSTVNQKGGATTIEDWYAYDKEGRMLVGEGFIKNGKIIIGATKEKNWDSFEAGNLASTSPKGYLMSYDAIGRRVYSESFDRAVFAHTFDSVDRAYYVDYSGDIYLGSKYSYSDNNELIEITVSQVARGVLSDSSTPLETIYSGYGGTRNDSYVIFSPTGIAQKTYSASYDLAGRRLSQTDYKLDLKRGDKTVSTSVTTTSYTYRGDGALASQISHKDGKLQQSSYFSELGMLDAAGNQLAYRYVYYNTNGKINHRGDYSTSYKAFDAYREDVSKITRTNGGKSGTTTNSYTSRGELIQTVGVGGNVFTRRLASNREGQLNVRQEASGASQRYIYQQGSSIANVGNASAPTITDSFEPILIDELARTPSNYLIEEGDTLQSIAQSIWGDSSLWYLIADANGLDTSKALVAGDNLRIPSVTSTNHNNSTTFKPYDPKDVIGDTKPRTVAPPPPKPKKKKCGGIASIVMVVVAVVATIFTAGAAALAMGAVASTTGVMAAGMAALTGSAGLLGVGAAVVGGIAGSAAGQISGKAMGVVDSFSWKQVAVGGLTAGFTAGIGSLAQAGSLGSWAETASTALSNGNASVGVYAAQGTVSYATGMMASKIVGLNTSFSWRNVAASAVGSAIAGYANSSSGISNSLIRGQVSAHASALIKDKWFGGDKPDYAQVAADAFGNTLGNFVVDQLRQPSANTIRHAQELARVSDNEATSPVIRHMLANGATPEDVGRIFNSSELRETLLHPTQATGNGGYLTYADDGVWVGVPPIEQPLTYTLNDQSYTINSNAFADRANTLVPPIHDGLIGLGRFAEANPNATQLLGYAAQGLSYALMGPVAALRDMASQAILGPVLDQARDYAIERISGFYQSKGVMAENAGVLASGTLFGMEAAAGRVTSAVTGAKQYVIQANGKSSRAKDFNFLNKSGMFYPSIPDLRTGRSVPFPSGELSRTPKAERVTWGAKERGDFIKAWYDHGYATPRGGWGNYDIHHIKPREFGGSNEFWNLTPVERGFHQQEYNSFWRDM